MKSRLLSVFIALTILAALLSPVGNIANAGQAEKHYLFRGGAKEAKIHNEVLAAFEREDYVHVLVMLRKQTDVQLAAHQAFRVLPAGTAPAKAKLNARYAVVDELRLTAQNTQSGILEYLEEQQVSGAVKEVDSYFIVNLVHVLATEGVVQDLAQRGEVQSILPSNWVATEKPIVSDDSDDGPGRQWNLESVQAYAAWDTYGLDGVGVVVGLIDTGTDYTHEALMEKWRGYTGAGGFDPEYNWHDSVNGEPMPYDEPWFCHGTHVAGTILGGHPETNNLIGVAPGAQWITAKAFDEDGGWEHWLLEAAQYMLAPTDAFGEPNPAMAPDIVNNSWGGGAGLNEWFRPMVQAWRAAEILPVFSAGNTNEGSTPGSVSVPANYPECIAVAAVDADNIRGAFSNQGPGPYDDLKPDISAPGVAVRSSVIGGYEDGWSGTSMAAPHVSGIAALLLQADMGLPVDMVEDILVASAHPLTDDEYPESPNYGYGRGLVSACDAIEAYLHGFGTITGQVLVPGVDAELPVIKHAPVTVGYEQTEMALTATIADDVAVVEAKLQIHMPGQTHWDSVPLVKVAGDHRRGEYKGIVPGMQMQAQGLTYKFVATDWVGNTVETPAYQVDVVLGALPGTDWNFEDYPQGWLFDGDWEWGAPTAGPTPYTGTKLVATNLDGYYSPYSESWLQSPPLDLRNAATASVRLKHWCEIDLDYDVARVIVTTDFVKGDIVAEITGYTGDWQNMYINLDGYCGSPDPVYVLFYLCSDWTEYLLGWYIDSVDFVGVDDKAPSAPESCCAYPLDTGLFLGWEQAVETDVAGYSVYRSLNEGGPYEKHAVTADSYYIDRALNGGVEYYYVLTAFDQAGNESVYSEEISAVAPFFTLLLATDLEEDDGGLFADGTNNCWQWGTPTSGPGRAFSGAKVWATNLDGPYPKNSACWLETPAFALDGYEAIELEFAHWFEIEDYYDYGAVEISCNGGPWLGIDCFSGEQPFWDKRILNLDYFAGSSVRFRFVFHSNRRNQNDGWYLDDLKLIVAETRTYSLDGILPTGLVKRKVPTNPFAFPDGFALAAKVPLAGGQLASDSGIPADAFVTVLESGRSTRTNPATGHYRLVAPALDEGESATLRYEAYGYYPRELPFTLAKDETKEIDVLLEPIPRGGLTGSVASLTGGPIPGATLTLVEDRRVDSVVSDEEGAFVFEQILEGEYTLRIFAKGYDVAQVPVSVQGGKIETVSITLTPFLGYEDEIYYDCGEAEGAGAWGQGGNGWAVRFTPESEAVIDGASILLPDWLDHGDTGFLVAVHTSLANGEPGPRVIPPVEADGQVGAWTYVDFSDWGFVTDRDFYVVYIQKYDFPLCPYLGFDMRSGVGRTYDFVDGNFYQADPLEGQAMIRASVLYPLQPPAFFAPGDGAFINTESVALTGYIAADALVSIYVNGEAAYREELERGEFQVEIELVEGENYITAAAETPLGSTGLSAPFLVTRDTDAPRLAITAPEPDTYTNQPALIVSGTAQDPYLEKVSINSHEVEYDEQGAFSVKVLVEEGENQLSIAAIDKAGNKTETTVSVFVDLQPPEITAPWPAADQYLYGGHQLEVSFKGEAGGAASFAIIAPGLTPAGGQRLPMNEVRPGEYQGVWLIPTEAKLAGAFVEFELIDKAGNRSVLVAPGRLFVDRAGCQRLAGSNRYETAAAISRECWAAAEYVVIARGDDYADALAGAPLAYSLNAPILLTSSAGLSPETAREIQRLGADKAIVLGGTGAISPAVVDALCAQGLAVERVAGANRFTTACLIAQRLAPAGDKVVLVNGYSFADALSTAAYAARQGLPILLSGPNRLPPTTAEFIRGLGPEAEAIVVGGRAVISDDLLTDLPNPVRLEGRDRYATSVAVADYFQPGSRSVYVATGLGFADALAGAPLAAKENSGLLLVGNVIPASVRGYLVERSVLKVTIFGGAGAVSQALEQELAALIR